MDFDTYNGIRLITDQVSTQIVIKLTFVIIVMIAIMIGLFIILYLYYNRQKSYYNRLESYKNITEDRYDKRLNQIDNRLDMYNMGQLFNNNSPISQKMDKVSDLRKSYINLNTQGNDIGGYKLVPVNNSNEWEQAFTQSLF